MALLSKLHPVVLKAGTTKASNILEGYAAFWKIPYQLNILNAEESIIFTSDRATAFQSPTNHSVILTPVGREEAEKAASAAGAGVSTEENLGPVECLRAVFLASVVKIAGPVPRIGFWRRGKGYALSVTHDVETSTGLKKGAERLMEVEGRLKIRSTWNIPSDRYPLNA